ncbi:MAG: DNA repair protein RecO [Clostridiales bacterium]|nr:DNA repair protein RecO [Clostridiales bacterium]
MRERQVEALVLKKEPFQEADLVVTLLTREGELLRVLAKGARRPKSSLLAAVQPFVKGRYLLWPSRSLPGIRQAQVEAGRSLLRLHPLPMAAASYGVEATLAFSAEGNPAPELYRLLDRFLDLVEAHREASLDQWETFLLAFEDALLTVSGYGPGWESCPTCGEALAGGSYRFRPLEGAAFHEGCSPGEGLPLGGEALGALRFLARPASLPLAFRLQLSPGAREEASRVLEAHLLGILGKPLKTRRAIHRWKGGAGHGSGVGNL